MKYKSLFSNENKLLFWIIIYIIINQTTSPISFEYPHSFYLPNRNIFVIHKLGITICNLNLTEIIKNVIVFENDEKITEESLSKVTSIIENGYIFNIINDKIYIFDDVGNLLFKSNNKILETGENPAYYTLAPVKISNGYYYYVIGFINNNITLLYYKYNIANKQNNLIISMKNFQKSYFTNNRVYIESKSLACNYMKNETLESLLCFYLSSQLSNSEYKYYSTIISFYINENEIKDIDNNFLLYDFGNYKYIKSTVNIDHSFAFVCMVPYEGLNICFKYSFDLEKVKLLK